MTNPLAVGSLRPELSWRLESSRRGAIQVAYQIRAATALGRLGATNHWDSGKREATNILRARYEGGSPAVGQRIYWQVRVWDDSGEVSDWSPPQWWETAPLALADWKAVWITRPRHASSDDADLFADNPAPLFRKAFALSKPVAQARLHVSGLGLYELSLNGRPVGDQLLDPAWSDYSRRVFFSTYDVTQALRSGTNVVGVMLGNGWFNPLPLRMWGKVNLRERLTVGEPRLLMQLAVEYMDGTSEHIVSDSSWRVAVGPVLRNNLYLGEVYDARRELKAWNQIDYDDTNWPLAVEADDVRLGLLQPQTIPAVRVSRELPPTKVTEPEPGVYVFDFGQNFAGIARLNVKGTNGARIRLRYGELLYPDGTLNGMTAVCGQIKRGGKAYRYDGRGLPQTAFQQDEYILSGNGTETFQPRFTYHGFRYVEVSGLARKPESNTLVGLVLHSDVGSVGQFSCSNPLLNQIQEITRRSILSNLQGVQTDCPHREKFGYGGDIVAAGEATIMNFDMSQLYSKIVQDFADAVRTNGGFTETAPFVGIADQGLGGGAGPIEWGTAHPYLVWQMYRYYGNRQLLAEQYDAVVRWLGLIESRARDGILDNGIGDHESLASCSRALSGTAFYYLNAELAARMARALGNESDAVRAEYLAQQIKRAFNRRFLQAESGRYDNGVQAAQALSLHMQLVPDECRDNAVKCLVDNIEGERLGHLSTGIFGTRSMLAALTEAGRADVAYGVVNRLTFPGWGYMIQQGATTLWEHWQFSDSTYSHNHYMFGSVSEWFYQALGGIQPSPDAEGFDKIIISPRIISGLTWVKASYNSVRGPIVSEWEVQGDQFKARVVIPVGSVAEVYLPSPNPRDLCEGGYPLEKQSGIKFLGHAKGTTHLRVSCGDYRFTSRMK